MVEPVDGSLGGMNFGVLERGHQKDRRLLVSGVLEIEV